MTVQDDTPAGYNPRATPDRTAGPAVSASSAPARRVSTETKAAFKTTEFLAYVIAVAAVIVMSYLVKTNDGHDDYFRADTAAFYCVLLTIGYMVSRGFAKSGSREPYDRD